MCDEAMRMEPRSLEFVPDRFNIERMCNVAVTREPYNLWHAPDHLKAREMCKEAMCDNPAVFFRIPDSFKTQKCCIKAVEVDPWQLDDVPDHFKRKKNVWWGSEGRHFLFVLCSQLVCYREGLYGWHDDYYDNDGNYLVDDEDKLFAWYNGYKKWKAQKAKIKEELLPIAWHPDRVMDWCMSEEEKVWWK